MSERLPSPEQLQKFSKQLDKLDKISEAVTQQADRILEDFKKDPLAPGFLKNLSTTIKLWEGLSVSPQSLLKVPLDNDPYEFYVKEITKIRTELWNALPGYAKTALMEARKKIEPNDTKKAQEFEKLMIDLCRAYQRDPKIFSEKNVREALALPPK